MIVVILTIVTIVNDHMEIESGLFFWKLRDRKIPPRFHIQISGLLFGRECAPIDNFLGRVSRDGIVC